MTSKSHNRIAMLPPPGPIVYTARKDLSTTSVPPLFHDALAIRYEVFIKEQNCNPDLEIDDADPTSFHFVLFAPSNEGEKDDTPAATMRLVSATPHHDHTPSVPHGSAEAATASDAHGAGEMATTEPNYAQSSSSLWDGQEAYALIGRLATLKSQRGKGFGKVLVEHALEWAGRHAGEVGQGWKGLLLAHAQVKVEGWYAGMGWVRDEGLGKWWEEGIEHVGMWKRVSVGGV